MGSKSNKAPNYQGQAGQQPQSFQQQGQPKNTQAPQYSQQAQQQQQFAAPQQPQYQQSAQYRPQYGQQYGQPFNKQQHIAEQQRKWGGQSGTPQQYADRGQTGAAPVDENAYKPSAEGQAKLDAVNKFEAGGGVLRPAPGYETGEFVRSPEAQATQDRLLAKHEGRWKGSPEQVAYDKQQEEQAQQGEQQQQQQQQMQEAMASKKRGAPPSYGGGQQQQQPQQPQQQQYSGMMGAFNNASAEAQRRQQQQQQPPPVQYYGEGSNMLMRNRPMPQGSYGGYYRQQGDPYQYGGG